MVRKPTTPRYVVLFRVSTPRQGRSGLGLAAQRETVSNFLRSCGGEVVAEVTEIESGRGVEADRPQLCEAITACRIHRARLLVARLDRLSRDAAWLLGLERRGVDFVVASHPDVNRLTVGVLALMAEEERNACATRTRQALAAARARGVRLGNPENLRNQSTGRINGARSNRVKAAEFADDLRPVINEIMATKTISLRRIATALDARNIPTRRGSTWTAMQVSRVLHHLDIHKSAA